MTTDENPYRPPSTNPYHPPQILEDVHDGRGWWARLKLFFGRPVFPTGSIFIHYGVLLEIDSLDASYVNAYIPISKNDIELVQRAVDEAVRVFAEARMAFPDYAVAIVSRSKLRIRMIESYSRLEAFAEQELEISSIGKYPKPLGL